MPHFISAGLGPSAAPGPRGGRAVRSMGQRPIIVLDAVHRVKQRGLWVRGWRRRPPRPPLWRCSATEGLEPQGQVPSQSALPWPRLGSPERPVDAESAPDLCTAISSSPPPPPPLWGAGGAGRARLPF